jgi:CheY-like chemotaxis protein
MARIVVVEDSPSNRLLLCEILRLRGHDVLEAATVEQARTHLGAGAPPEIVLCDFNVPGGGGQSLLREMRADRRLQAVPVVVVTGEAQTGDRERLLAAGFDGYISKPIDTVRFGPQVEGFLKGE